MLALLKSAACMGAAAGFAILLPCCSPFYGRVYAGALQLSKRRWTVPAPRPRWPCDFDSDWEGRAARSAFPGTAIYE